MQKEVSRREILRGLGLTGVGIVVANVAKGAQQCAVPTPKQIEGPFYPVLEQSDTNSNLIQVEGRSGIALGQYISISGRLFDAETCTPIQGALIEIWQACATGRYDHPEDPNTTVPLDPNFQYWGKAVTSAEGAYQFYTIKPGAYPATETWMRPPHIHFKVSAPGFPIFITQMYFAGETLNDTDLLLNGLSPAQRSMLVVPFKMSSHAQRRNFMDGTFDLYLSKGGHSRATPLVDD